MSEEQLELMKKTLKYLKTKENTRNVKCLTTYEAERLLNYINEKDKEIERLNSNCKTLAKMLDKEIEKNNKAIDLLEKNIYNKSNLLNILKEEYNVSEFR